MEELRQGAQPTIDSILRNLNAKWIVGGHEQGAFGTDPADTSSWSSVPPGRARKERLRGPQRGQSGACHDDLCLSG